MISPKQVTPKEAADLIEQGALLVDIREAAERDTGVIPRAAHAPLSELATAEISAVPGQPVIFHCKTGGRSGQNAAALAARVTGGECYLLSGGIDAWRAEGLPIEPPK